MLIWLVISRQYIPIALNMFSTGCLAGVCLVYMLAMDTNIISW